MFCLSSLFKYGMVVRVLNKLIYIIYYRLLVMSERFVVRVPRESRSIDVGTLEFTISLMDSEGDSLLHDVERRGVKLEKRD